MVNSVLFGTLSFSTLVVATPLSLSSIDTRQWDNPTPPSSPADLFAPSPQLAPTDTNSYFPIPPDLNVPEGYSMGFSTVKTRTLPDPPKILVQNSPWLISRVARLGTHRTAEHLHHELPARAPFLHNCRPNVTIRCLCRCRWSFDNRRRR